jgi:hypothetical protein
MNTQLLRYNMLTEHLTFLPIPPADAGFRANGSHQVFAVDTRLVVG